MENEWAEAKKVSEVSGWIIYQDSLKVRSIHRRYSVRKGVLRNFAKFTGKHRCKSLFFNKVAGLSQSLFFNKVAGISLATLLKKRL